MKIIRKDDFLKASGIHDLHIDPVYAVNRERQFIYYNRAYRHLAGIKERKTDGRRICHECLRLEICDEACPMDKIITSKKVVRLAEIHARDKLDQTHTFDIVGTPLFNQDDEVDGVVFILRDMSVEEQIHKKYKGMIAKEREERERAVQLAKDLEKTKSYVENIIKSMIDTLVVITPDGVIQLVNNAILDLLGYKANELIGKHIKMIFEEAPTFWELGLRDSVGDKERFFKYIEDFYLSKDGRRIPVLFSSSVMRDANEEVQGIVCVALDITERREMEEAIRASEEKYRILVETIPDIIYSLGPEGKFSFVSHAVKDLGYDPEELIGKHFRKIIISDDFEDVSRATFISKDKENISNGTDELKCFDERRTGERMTRNLEVRLVPRGQKDDSNKIYYGEVSSSGDWHRDAQDKEKEFLGSIGIIRDITKRKEAEAEVQRKSRLERYFAPQVVKSIIESGDQQKVLAARKVLTVMFTDIRGFTKFSENMEPEDLAGVLNEYFSEMTKIIFTHEGTIDKFLGDGIMIFFGDPIPQDDHALRAVHCAQEMNRRLLTMQKEWSSKSENPIMIGVGINSGNIMVGNIGSYERMEYTVIGSHVNLAARLQALAGPGEIILSASTHELVKDKIQVENKGIHTIRGFTKPIPVFKVIERLGNSTIY